MTQLNTCRVTVSMKASRHVLHLEVFLEELHTSFKGTFLSSLDLGVAL